MTGIGAELAWMLVVAVGSGLLALAYALSPVPDGVCRFCTGSGAEGVHLSATTCEGCGGSGKSPPTRPERMQMSELRERIAEIVGCGCSGCAPGDSYGHDGSCKVQAILALLDEPEPERRDFCRLFDIDPDTEHWTWRELYQETRARLASPTPTSADEGGGEG